MKMFVGSFFLISDVGLLTFTGFGFLGRTLNAIVFFSGFLSPKVQPPSQGFSSGFLSPNVQPPSHGFSSGFLSPRVQPPSHGFSSGLSPSVQPPSHGFTSGFLAPSVQPPSHPPSFSAFAYMTAFFFLMSDASSGFDEREETTLGL